MSEVALQDNDYFGSLTSVLASFAQDTTGYYRELRRLAGPRCVFRDDELQAWVVTSYSDCQRLLSSSSLSKSRLTLKSLNIPSRLSTLVDCAQSIVDKQMIFDETPASTCAHRNWEQAFRKGREYVSHDRLIGLAREGLDALPRGVEVDFYSNVLRPYVSRVIAARLGLNEDERLQLYPLVYGYADFLDGKALNWQSISKALLSLVALAGFTSRSFERLHDVAPDPGCDSARWIANYVLNLVAGHESTAYALGIAILNMAQLSYDRKCNIESKIISEALRFDSPIQLIGRMARQDINLSGGPLIRSGEKVFLHIGAANRDPVRFADPDCFLPGRSSGRNLAFGWGAGRCIGMTLALAEAKAFLTVVREILESNRFVVGSPTWAHGLAGRAFSSLPVILIAPDLR